MKQIIAIIIIMAIGTSLANAENVSANYYGLFFDYPSDWSLESIDENKLKISADSGNLELQMHRYILPDNNQIASHDDMITAIGGLYADMGLKSFPEIQIAYIDNNTVAAFETTSESQTGTINLIKGFLCNAVSSGQTLYLLKTAIPANIDPELLTKLRNILSSAYINETVRDELYESGNIKNYLYVLLILMLVAFFYARNRRIQQSNNPLGRNSSKFWRCSECRMVNHFDHNQCRRCGSDKPLTAMRQKN